MSTESGTNSPSTALSQDAVISFLKGQLTNQADHICTHCAHIFLIGNIAYKVKSEVKYSYLDMSTLEKCAKLLEREYQLNVAVLPDIYLGGVPTTLDDKQQLRINGSGQVVECALKMRMVDGYYTGARRVGAPGQGNGCAVDINQVPDVGWSGLTDRSRCVKQ